MIGWVQALSFSLFGIAVVAGLTSLAHAWLSNRHDREMKRLEQDHEILQE